MILVNVTFHNKHPSREVALDSDDMSGLLDRIDGNKRVKIHERNI